MVPALLIAAAVANHTRSDGASHYLATQRYEDVYYLPPPTWLHVFSLGHREALAGLIWLRSLVYFGEELGHRGPVENLYHYADAMLSLDPYFLKVYSWVASCALYRTGEITVKDARRAIEYLERGAQLFPDDGELAWTLGANYLYELPPMLKDKAEILEARRKGLEHLTVAARRGAGPAWLVLSTATELGKLGQRQQELSHLEEVYGQVTDPEVKRQVAMRLERLRDATFVEALRRTYDEIAAEQRATLPYIDRDLYLLIRPVPAFDGRALMLRGFDPEGERFADDDAEGGEQPAP
ncbi:MAG TPA: hypothetical protein VK509_00960 [Polyangiales bacterium]|nr:hypothetical protein [Polyangiales bacterium]